MEHKCVTRPIVFQNIDQGCTSPQFVLVAQCSLMYFFTRLSFCWTWWHWAFPAIGWPRGTIDLRMLSFRFLLRPRCLPLGTATPGHPDSASGHHRHRADIFRGCQCRRSGCDRRIPSPDDWVDWCKHLFNSGRVVVVYVWSVASLVLWSIVFRLRLSADSGHTSSWRSVCPTFSPGWGRMSRAVVTRGFFSECWSRRVRDGSREMIWRGLSQVLFCMCDGFLHSDKQHLGQEVTNYYKSRFKIMSKIGPPMSTVDNKRFAILIDELKLPCNLSSPRWTKVT